MSLPQSCPRFPGRAMMVLLAALAVTTRVWAETDDAPAPGHSLVYVSLTVGILGLLAALAAIFLSWRARAVAVHAAEEAGTARARANQIQQGGGNGGEALAAAERVWSTRFAALEAQLQGAGRPSTTRAAFAQPSSDLATRVENVEKSIAGLSVMVAQTRRPTPAAASAVPETPGVAWPVALSGESSGMNDVRQALTQAMKTDEAGVRTLLEKMKAAERWASAKPGASEVAPALQEISTLLLAALRRGASVAPLDGVLFSDRVLAALRALWKPFLPSLDCRSFYPGTTFDPDWMEDHTRAGLRRPVISEMLSWAVFEKTDSGRRVLAKAHVTAE